MPTGYKAFVLKGNVLLCRGSKYRVGSTTSYTHGLYYCKSINCLVTQQEPHTNIVYANVVADESVSAFDGDDWYSTKSIYVKGLLQGEVIENNSTYNFKDGQLHGICSCHRAPDHIHTYNINTICIPQGITEIVSDYKDIYPEVSIDIACLLAQDNVDIPIYQRRYKFRRGMDNYNSTYIPKGIRTDISTICQRVQDQLIF